MAIRAEDTQVQIRNALHQRLERLPDSIERADVLRTADPAEHRAAGVATHPRPLAIELIGEKRIARAPVDPCQSNDCLGYTAGFPVAAMSKGQPFELGFDTLASGLPRPRPDDGSLGGGFGSSHTGGMNALFADGHVQLISYDIDTAVFQALCNLHDTNDIQLDDLNP